MMERTDRVLMRVLLQTAGCALLAFSSCAASTGTVDDVSVLYRSNVQGEPVRITKKVELADDIQAGAYKVRARIKPTKLGLRWMTGVGGVGNDVVDVPVVNGKLVGLADLGHSDELHVLYDEMDSHNLGRLSLNLAVKSGVPGIAKTDCVTTYEDDDLVAREVVDVASADFLDRDYLYFAKRELRLPYDSTWRFTQSGPNTVVQRRFKRDLRDIETIDVVFSEKTTIKRINLRITLDDYTKATEIIEWEDLSWRYGEIDGRVSLQMHIGELIRQKYRDAKHIALDEMVVFIEGKAEDIIRESYIHSIVFRGFSAGAVAQGDDHCIYLSARTKHISGRRSLFLVDLRELRSKAKKRMRIEEAALSIFSENRAQPSFSGLRIRRVSAVRFPDGTDTMSLASENLAANKRGSRNRVVDSVAKSESPLVARDIHAHPAIEITPRGGHVNVSIHSEVLEHGGGASWTTDIHHKLSGVVGIRIRYRYQAESLPAKIEACQLNLIVKYSGTPQPFCLGHESGMIFLPMDELLDAAQERPSQESGSLLWRLRLANTAGEMHAPVVVDLSMMLVRAELQKVKDEIFDYPLMEINQVSLPSSILKKVPTSKLFEKNTILDLGEIRIHQAASTGLPLISKADNPYVHVEEIYLLRKDPISEDALNALLVKDAIKTLKPSFFWPVVKIIFGIAVVAITLRLSRKYWIMIKGATIECVSRAESGVTLFRKNLVKTLPRFIKLTNRMVGILALFFTVWLMLRPERLNQLGVALIVAIAVIMFGAIWHELRMAEREQVNTQRQMKFFIGQGNKIPFMVNVLTCVISVAPYLWFVANPDEGDYRLSLLLLLISMGYLYLPLVNRIAGRMSDLNLLMLRKLSGWSSDLSLRPAAWIFVATLLYVSGFFARFGRSENSYFALAGLAMFLSWRDFMPIARSKVDKYWPAGAETVIRDKGDYYLTGFILSLVLVAIMHITRLSVIAEQVAVIGLYMLVAWVFFESRNLLRKRK